MFINNIFTSVTTAAIAGYVFFCSLNDQQKKSQFDWNLYSDNTYVN